MNYLKEITIAGLLHDIGKFIQRAGIDEFKSSNDYILCPQKNGRYTHLHVLYTDKFLEDNKKIFKDIDADKMIALASKHHVAEKPLEKIISIADCLSSGMDRINKDKSEDEMEGIKFYETPLKSIFSNISLDNERIENNYYYKLGKLIPENIFPYENIRLSQDIYKELFNDFKNDFDKLSKINLKNYNEFLSALITLIEQYTWCIPSSTIDIPDISLFDHLMTTSAIATVLYKYHFDNNTIDDIQQIENEEEEKFLIFSGDLSGIQNYIFDIKNNKYSAKLLRARSFELQLFTESAANYILEKLELPTVCKIMNAGGRFLILAPNNEKTKNKLQECREEIEGLCLDRYFGELSLNISKGIPLNARCFRQGLFGLAFTRINQDVNEAKLNKLSTKLKNKSNFILDKEYNEIISNQELCPACKKRAKKKNDLCYVCNNLFEVGTMLPKADSFFISDKANNNVSLKFFNSYFCMSDSSVRKNEFNIFINKFEPGHSIYHSPYYVPINDNNEVVNFEDIADKSEGVKYLAMFKADLDNLGAIFSIGLGDKISISRYSTLSRMLHYFFSEYLNYFLKENYPNIYTVFSGGDDLCVIGPWNEIINFSIDFQKKFLRFTNNNKLTISGGISITHKNLPVIKMVDEAEELLENSKSKEGKNSISLFQSTMKWDEFSKLIDFAKDYLDKKIKDKEITKGGVYRLLQYDKRRKAANEKEGKTSYNLLWHAHFVYDITRNIKNNEKREKFYKDIMQIYNDKSIDLKVAIYYTILKNRERS